ncbi:MAG: hypothetical protein WBF90_32205 [Rivularia sp. (in: cyanobacteria)]
MAQKRVVLNPKYEAQATSILESTGIENYSQLFSIFIKTYGDKLVKALQESK